MLKCLKTDVYVEAVVMIVCIHNMVFEQTY